MLLISTWQPDAENGANDTVRDTYLQSWGDHLDYRFYYDKSREPGDLKQDELWFDVDSGLLNTSFKTKAAIEWLLNTKEGPYAYVFVVPTDCYVLVPRLLLSGFDRWDYSGYHTYDEYHIGGGSGYWLSRRAMEAVAAFPCYPDYEDRWVGEACKVANIPGIHDVRYASVEQPYVPESITLHMSKGSGNYDPQWMRNLHAKVLEGKIFQV